MAGRNDAGRDGEPASGAAEGPDGDHSPTVTPPERDTDDRASAPPGVPNSDADRPTAEPAVAVEGLTKRFGSDPDAVMAVEDVSFEIASGSVVGLLGPNGAGKTTLIKCILGLVLPDSGTVEIRGIDARKRPRAAYARTDAMLEGARNDYWRLTVRENLRYFATISGVDPDAVADRHARLLDQLGLADKADTPVRDLSRGMKQKVSLASVLAGRAEVVFLDEPTLGLDIESSRTLQRELRRLADEEGLTVVLSSHDMGVIETVCDRVLVMAGGRIVADDAVADLLRGPDATGVRVASPDLNRETVRALRDRFRVPDVERLASGARVEVATTGDGLYDLLGFLQARDVTPEHVTTVEPDLDDVVVELATNGARESDDTGQRADRGEADE